MNGLKMERTNFSELPRFACVKMSRIQSGVWPRESVPCRGWFRGRTILVLRLGVVTTGWRVIEPRTPFLNGLIPTLFWRPFEVRLRPRYWGEASGVPTCRDYNIKECCENPKKIRKQIIIRLVMTSFNEWFKFELNYLSLLVDFFLFFLFFYTHLGYPLNYKTTK